MTQISRTTRTKQIPIKISVPLSLFFFILVLLSVFHGFLSLSVSKSFAFVTGERLRIPGTGDAVLIKRTAIELFDRITGNIGSVFMIDLDAHIFTVVANHNIDCLGPGTVAFLLNLESVFATQVVTIFSNSKPGILNLLLFAGTHGKTFIGIRFWENFVDSVGNTVCDDIYSGEYKSCDKDSREKTENWHKNSPALPAAALFADLFCLIGQSAVMHAADTVEVIGVDFNFFILKDMLPPDTFGIGTINVMFTCER